MRYTEIRNAIKKKRKASVKKARRETEQNFCFSGGGKMVNNIDFIELNCDSPKIKEFYNLLCFKLKRPCTDAIINM